MRAKLVLDSTLVEIIFGYLHKEMLRGPGLKFCNLGGEY
jgi:hypothetical protein